jgi:hypothetical protein
MVGDAMSPPGWTKTLPCRLRLAVRLLFKEEFIDQGLLDLWLARIKKEHA